MYVLHRYPTEMANGIKKLAEQNPITIEEAEGYYLMGGFDHAQQLIDYKRITHATEREMQWYNSVLWEIRNKNAMEQLRQL